jgi:hypothetical protein
MYTGGVQHHQQQQQHQYQQQYAGLIDPHLVAVADVQPMAVGPPQAGSAVLGVGGQQMVMHRHVTTRVPPELLGGGGSHLYHNPAGESERGVRVREE